MGSLATTLARGRRKAEVLMVDSCKIERQTGTALDDDPASPTYLEMVPTFEDVYEGKCRVQINVGADSLPDGGGREWTVQQVSVQLPVVGSESVVIDDVIEIVAAVNDAALVGHRYTVSQLFAKTHATSRRLLCQEVTA